MSYKVKPKLNVLRHLNAYKAKQGAQTPTPFKRTSKKNPARKGGRL